MSLLAKLSGILTIESAQLPTLIIKLFTINLVDQISNTIVFKTLGIIFFQICLTDIHWVSFQYTRAHNWCEAISIKLDESDSYYRGHQGRD